MIYPRKNSKTGLENSKPQIMMGKTLKVSIRVTFGSEEQSTSDSETSTGRANTSCSRWLA